MGLLGLLVLLLVVGAASGFDCDALCNGPVSEVWGCFLAPNGTRMERAQSTPCPPFPTSASCYVHGMNWTFLHPGRCGCPNNCGGKSNGACVNGVCQCFGSFSGSSCEVCESCTCGVGTNLADCSGINRYKKRPPHLISGKRWTDSEDYGWHHPLFNQSTITQAYLQISEADLAFLLNPANDESRTYKPCTVLLTNNVINQTVSCGVRIHGDTSRAFLHKSFKIKFDQDLFQQAELTLKASERSPMTVREVQAMNLLYSMNTFTYRGAHYQLFVNGQFFGGYIGIESIGKEQFLKSRLEPNMLGGNLFKASENALAYLGPLDGRTRAKYQEMFDGPAEELGQVVDLLKVLASGDVDAIEIAFDVEYFLRTYSTSVLTGNWDGIFDGNNYWLYFPPRGGRALLWRHDLDLSYGLYTGYSLQFHQNVFWNNRSIWNWTGFDAGNGWVTDPISPMIPKVPGWKSIFERYIRLILDHYMLPGVALELFEEDQTFVAPLLRKDLWKGPDFGWTMETFEEAITSNLRNNKGSINLSVAQFLRDRTVSALSQLC